MVREVERDMTGVIAWRYPHIERPRAELSPVTASDHLAGGGPVAVPSVTPGPLSITAIHDRIFGNPLEQVLAYLVRTAFPGATMERQGVEKALALLQPEFRRRLQDTFRDARSQGIEAGVFSAYRPPAFGVGGFRNKFNSLHAVGLAVDVSGIGSPGSEKARRFHQIAARHGVYCVYSYRSRSEWNHCQATRILVTTPQLRATIVASGPRDRELMWLVGARYIDAGPRRVDLRRRSGA
jgi:hypothetical protein